MKIEVGVYEHPLEDGRDHSAQDYIPSLLLGRTEVSFPAGAYDDYRICVEDSKPAAVSEAIRLLEEVVTELKGLLK